ncbi:zf-HC2 domain-containing protein [Cellulomonas sp. WB94]|uniref:zf-HC2 domain-containing protein n=1 Tax=Cellulomonas sp. WB94 TaxID=2173174 RepID=UPI001F5B8068|nr:zf-HC2 domain-containing protein [Cellulomonas sp. WB94]
MSHLGDRISALADGQLSPAATERALAHVATCCLCTSELAAARAARRAVASADSVAPTADLTARLLSLAGAAPREGGPVRVDPFAYPTAGGASWGGGPRLDRGVPAHTLTGDLTARRSIRRITVGSLTGLGVMVVTLFALGDGPAVLPTDGPAQSFALLGAATPLAAPAVVAGTSGAVSSGSWHPLVRVVADDTGTAGATDYIAWMRAHGWTAPTQVPVGWTVTAVRLLDETTLEVDLVGPEGTLVVTERHGRLDTDALVGTERRVVADRTVYVLGATPWHAAWQSGDTVVEVVAATGSGDVETLVAQFPLDAYDQGVPARITRGWGTMTQTLVQP